MSICLTRFPIGVLGEPYLYHNLEDFTRMWEGCGRVSDCEVVYKDCMIVKIVQL